MGKPLPRVGARRVFLRIPTVDWPAITQGHKTEVRLSDRGNLMRLVTPCAVVGWTRSGGQQRFRLLVCEERWQEPLGAISDESVRREGFETRKEFRRYWRGRTHAHTFKPLTTVQVFRVRPFVPEDRRMLADKLFDRLYGDYLDPA